MRKRNYISLGLTTVVLAALFIVLRSAGRVMPTSDGNEPIETCCKKTESPVQGALIWQSLSRQFVSFSPCSN